MNAVIYARYSSSSQTEQSIEGQLRVCNEFAAKNGYTVIHEYIDRAMTGTNAERPEFLHMIDNAKLGEFSHIIVYKVDRFARNKYDSVFFKHKLGQSGVKVVSATEAISDTPEGRLVESILEVMAEMYSHDLSQKVKRGIRESILKGNHFGGNMLYGYKLVNKHIEIDEEKANIIRQVFQDYADGKSKKTIVDDLNARGLTTGKGKKFTVNSFWNTLSNQKYISEYYIDGIKVNYPPIIDKELFERVQRQLANKKQAPASAKAKEEYILHGKAFCGHCGSNMIGVSAIGRGKKKYCYYACSKQYKHKTCAKKQETKDHIEQYVIERTLEYVFAHGQADIIANKVLAMYGDTITDKRIKEYERILSRVELELDKCAALLLNADNEDIIKRLNAKANDLSLQKADTQKELSKLRLANSITPTKENILAWLNLFATGDIQDPDYRKRIIQIFVNAVFLFDDKLVMYYNVLDSDKPIEHADMLDNIAEHENTSNNGSYLMCQTLLSLGRTHRKLQQSSLLIQLATHTFQLEQVLPAPLVFAHKERDTILLFRHCTPSQPKVDGH